MISITLSPEQITAAPLEVRRWIEQELASTLGFLAQLERQPQPDRSELAACTAEEAVSLLELVKDDYLTCQVFFELGRGAEDNSTYHSVHPLSIADIMRNTRIHSSELQRSLAAINRALQHIRHDPSANLFGFDDGGHCYVHQDTYRNICRLWHDFVARQGQRMVDQEAGVGREARMAPADVVPSMGVQSLPMLEPLGNAAPRSFQAP